MSRRLTWTRCSPTVLQTTTILRKVRRMRRFWSSRLTSHSWACALTISFHSSDQRLWAIFRASGWSVSRNLPVLYTRLVIWPRRLRSTSQTSSQTHSTATALSIQRELQSSLLPSTDAWQLEEWRRQQLEQSPQPSVE